MIRIEQHLFDVMKVDGFTQQQCRDKVREILDALTGDRVTCVFEPEGVMLSTTVERIRHHLLSYPFREDNWFCAINFLETKCVIIEDGAGR